jgi:hypothetical protein
MLLLIDLSFNVRNVRYKIEREYVIYTLEQTLEIIKENIQKGSSYMNGSNIANRLRECLNFLKRTSLKKSPQKPEKTAPDNEY